MSAEQNVSRNPDAEIATRHEEIAPGAASGSARVSESPGVSSPHFRRFKVVSGMGHTKALWVVWDVEKNIYVNSSRDQDEMYALASALNAAAAEGTTDA